MCSDSGISGADVRLKGEGEVNIGAVRQIRLRAGSSGPSDAYTILGTFTTSTKTFKLDIDVSLLTCSYYFARSWLLHIQS